MCVLLFNVLTFKFSDSGGRFLVVNHGYRHRLVRYARRRCRAGGHGRGHARALVRMPVALKGLFGRSWLLARLCCGRIRGRRVIMITLLASATALLGCGRRAEDLLPKGAPVPERVLSPIPKVSALPEALDWRWVNGTVFTSRVGYQLLPSPCGSCWAFAATGALSDRVKIATKGRLVDFSISPQALLDCAKDAGTCNGGNPNLAYHYAATVGLPDETCLPYRGMDNSNWGESPCAERLCRRCDRFGSCNFVPRNATPAIQVAEYGSVTGVAAMKAEIAARGPIACLMYAHADSFEAYTGGVITDTTRTKASRTS